MSSTLTSPADSLTRATWLAATIGAFKPADLVGHVVTNRAARRDLAARLAPLCTEVSISGSVLWNLGADPRRRALLEMQQKGLLKDQSLPQFLAQLSPSAGDEFGRYLREALTGKQGSELEDAADADAQYSAYEIVGRANVGSAPEQALESAGIVEQRAHREAAEKQLAQTIGPDFVGRERELAALKEFALDGKVSDPEYSADPSPSPANLPKLYLHGVGGAGKSALVAKLVQALRQEGSGVAAVVVLDFDRPTLASVDRNEMTAELLRQISLSQPSIAKELTRLRRSSYEQFSNTELGDSGDQSTYRITSRVAYSVNTSLRSILESAGLLSARFVIVLDTFEEVLTLGIPFADAVYGMLMDLYLSASLSGLRVIMSGRAAPGDGPEEIAQLTTNTPTGQFEPVFGPHAARIRLRNLAPREALKLLQRRDIPARLASPLIRRYGTNPLVLRLLGDYAAEKGAEAVRALLHSEHSRQRYESELAQRILYSRILGRIRSDPAVRALASPGLVVRIVTPGVIKNVLARPCGLGTISDARAKDLFDKLARQVWLVRRLSDHVVTHRRDIRTMMLPLASEPRRGARRRRLAAQVNQIHRNALTYFQLKSDPELTASAQRDEALYHQLFVDPDTAFRNLELSAALPSLAGDLADFDTRTHARLRRRLGKSLSAKDLAALTDEEGAAYRMQVDSLAVRVAGAASAATIAETESKTLLPTDGTGITVAFAAGRFEEIARISGEVLNHFVKEASQSATIPLLTDMAHHETWLAALSTLIARPRERQLRPQARWRQQFYELLTSNWRQLWSRELDDRSQLNLAHYLTALVILLNRGRRDACVKELMRRLHKDGQDPKGHPLSISITSTASLRIAQLLSASAGSMGPPVLMKSVNLACLQYFAMLLDPAVAARHRSMRQARTRWEKILRSSRALNDVVASLRKTRTPLQTAGLTQSEALLADEVLHPLPWVMLPKANTVARSGDLSSISLRGMSPDLQAPMMAALRESFADRGTALKILRNLGRNKAWPSDLTEEFYDRHTLEGMAWTDSSLLTLCHFADRFAALPLLFEHARSGTVTWRLRQVHDTYEKLIMSTAKWATVGLLR